VHTYTRSAPAGLRSAEDQALASLPDNHIKSAMQALPQQFRDVVYYADVQGLPYREDRGNHEHPDRKPWLPSFNRGRRQLRKLLGDSAGDAATQTIITTP